MAPKAIPATHFKERCLALLDRVGPEGIVITRYGKPVVKLLPIEAESRDLIGALQGKLRIKGDTFSTGVFRHAES